jgi:hypothetical protein
VVRLVRQGKNISRALKDITSERAGRSRTGGATPPADEPGSGNGSERQPGESKARRKLSINNIKSYRVTGPLSIEVGIALNQTDPVPDAFAELAFTGGDWKVVGIVPQL